MKLNEIVKEVERMYLVNGYKPKSHEEIISKATWLQSNIFPNKIRQFVDEVLQYYEFPKIYDFNRHLENNPHYKESFFHKEKYPSQDAPVEEWCRKCMNSGLIPIHRFVGGLQYDFFVKCDCEASKRYSWIKTTYKEFYPGDMQFKWDPEKEFYYNVYQREVKKLVDQVERAKKLARLKGEKVDQVDYDKEAREDPVISRFLGRR
ncbi:MAG: hypothetical protein XD77_0873 [Marinimicrobia bacterium 46_47]|nr:MAG: hypothetical protein XD77_0873 [Marinimicrobia bacterium 46_47]